MGKTKNQRIQVQIIHDDVVKVFDRLLPSAKTSYINMAILFFQYHPQGKSFFKDYSPVAEDFFGNYIADNKDIIDLKSKIPNKPKENKEIVEKKTIVEDTQMQNLKEW